MGKKEGHREVSHSEGRNYEKVKDKKGDFVRFQFTTQRAVLQGELTFYLLKGIYELFGCDDTVQ